jgi:putative methyltransferase (TIGR04325 family)
VSLRRTARRFLRGLLKGEEPPEWQCLPEGWRTSDPRVTGWNVDSIVERQRAKWPEVLRLVSDTGPLPVHLWAHDLSRPGAAASTVLMAFGYVLALAAWEKDRVTLLDWGGGVGHYKLVSQALFPHLEIEYHCKDVPLLCKAGRELQPSASFHDDDESCFARDYDLVLASGSLEYVEDWKNVMRRLAGASRHYVYIARLPIVRRTGSFTVIQRPYRHGYATEYVSWILNRQEFLGHADSLRLRLVREILLGDGPVIRGAPEQCEFSGFLFSRAEGRDDD